MKKVCWPHQCSPAPPAPPTNKPSLHNNTATNTLILRNERAARSLSCAYLTDRPLFTTSKSVIGGRFDAMWATPPINKIVPHTRGLYLHVRHHLFPLFFNLQRACWSRALSLRVLFFNTKNTRGLATHKDVPRTSRALLITLHRTAHPCCIKYLVVREYISADTTLDICSS